METSDVVESLEKFFFDVLGTIIPGGLFIYVLEETIYKTWFLNLETGSLTFNSTLPTWIVFIVFSFIFGHVISSLGDKLLIPMFERIKTLTFKKEFELKKKKMENETMKNVFYIAFEKEMKSVIKNSKFLGHDLRNMAMSLTPEGNQIIYRFAFLGILNKSVFSVSFFALLFTSTLNLLNLFWPLKLNSVLFELKFSIILIVVMFTTLERYYYFDRISYETSFSQALAFILKIKHYKGALNDKK